MRYRLPFVSCTVIIAIAACGKPDPVANNVAASVAMPTPANDTVPSPAGGPPAARAANEPELAVEPQPEAAAALIPAALHGRWALTPGDCTSALGDAKGLLVISGKELRFYESRAVPSPGADADSDSIAGNFRFTGEGQTWTKFETLERRKDKLVRIDSNPTASYTYAQC